MLQLNRSISIIGYERNRFSSSLDNIKRLKRLLLSALEK